MEKLEMVYYNKLVASDANHPPSGHGSEKKSSDRK